jgi:hypothetical protein
VDAPIFVLRDSVVKGQSRKAFTTKDTKGH